MRPAAARNGLRRRIVLLESGGFALVILLLWLDEVVDVPHLLFGATQTPVNWVEGVIETSVVLLLGVVVTWRVRRRLGQIRLLEGLLPICSFCKKIRVDDTWVVVEEYVEEHSAAEFTHSLCPGCVAEHYRSARAAHVSPIPGRGQEKSHGREHDRDHQSSDSQVGEEP